MPDEQAGRRRKLVVPLGLIVIVVVVVFIIWQTQKTDQVVRPLPNGSGPVVSHLPDLAASLSKIKSISESRALAAKGNLRGLEAKKELPVGEDLYGKLKMESDGTIKFLQVGLSTRFRDADETNIAGQMKRLGDKAIAFQQWANRVTKTKGAEREDFISEILALLGEWLKGVREQNENAIKEISAKLGECRLRNWSELKPGA